MDNLKELDRENRETEKDEKEDDETVLILLRLKKGDPLVGKFDLIKEKYRSPTNSHTLRLILEDFVLE